MITLNTKIHEKCPHPFHAVHSKQKTEKKKKGVNKLTHKLTVLFIRDLPASDCLHPNASWWRSFCLQVLKLSNTYIIYCIYTSINRFQSLCGASLVGERLTSTDLR